jgi:hypothetical protein
VAQEPTNPKLWQMIIVQARAKFATYPSPGASHWVHEEYIKHGGQFEETSEYTKRKKQILKQYQQKLLDKHAKSKEQSKGDKSNEDKKKQW